MKQNQNEFSKWLVENKGFSTKSAHDTVSRMRRLLIISGEENFTDETLIIAERTKAFDKLTMCVKSQLRRTAHLLKEFNQSKGF